MGKDDKDPDEQPKGKIKMAACNHCGRSFAVDRLSTHEKICTNTKERKPFNVAEQRVIGTEAEDLLKSGHLKLDPPKPKERMSALQDRVNKSLQNKDPLPPIKQRLATARANRKQSANLTKDGKLKAYQVVFDENDGMKTKRSTKFPTAVPPPMTANGGKRLPKQSVDDRYLSAERARGRWKSASSRVNPNVLSSVPSGLTSSEDDDEGDFLGASMTSRKTVQSDAFDFLFDSQNLNPERILDHDALEKMTEEKLKEQKNGVPLLDKNAVKDSACCVVS